jgi:hypothetical protein
MKRLLGAFPLLMILFFALAARAQNAAKPQTAEVTKGAGAQQIAPQNEALPLLQNAKTIYLKNNGRSLAAYSAIERKMQQWGKYTLVHDAKQADLIMDINSPIVDGGFTTADSVSAPRVFRPEQANREQVLGLNGDVSLRLYDRQSQKLLFMKSEQPRWYDRQLSREQVIVDAAQWAARRFRDSVK